MGSGRAPPAGNGTFGTRIGAWQSPGEKKVFGRNFPVEGPREFFSAVNLGGNPFPELCGFGQSDGVNPSLITTPRYPRMF